MESKKSTQENKPQSPRAFESQIISQSLPIPEYKMGWIIGKKGSYINQLSKKSGANLTISDTKTKEYGTVWKYVQISGTSRSVDRAKKLLHIRLERLEPRDDQKQDGDDEEYFEEQNDFPNQDGGGHEGEPPPDLKKTAV